MTVNMLLGIARWLFWGFVLALVIAGVPLRMRQIYRKRRGRSMARLGVVLAGVGYELLFLGTLAQLADSFTLVDIQPWMSPSAVTIYLAVMGSCVLIGTTLIVS